MTYPSPQSLTSDFVHVGDVTTANFIQTMSEVVPCRKTYRRILKYHDLWVYLKGDRTSPHEVLEAPSYQEIPGMSSIRNLKSGGGS